MLYHKDFGFPAQFNPKIGTVCLTYSSHAHEESRADRYGALVLPRTLNTSKADCIEIEMLDGRVTKLVYRMPYDAVRDLCLVCRPKGNLFTVSTIWSNLKTDKHETLNPLKYKIGA